MIQIWKTIPLFISSTFRDMHAERDELNNVVFPAIAERLKPRRCRLEPIDLRIGVETDSTQTERERELTILKVCLAEIERSRPFLLVLLGDRYGWVPGSDRIDAASSEAGFTPTDNNASVTALEIEYGLLKKDPLQRRRSLLCLREPLPYDRMRDGKAAIFSDAHATDPGAPDRVRRLQKLKQNIVADSELSCHTLRYTLDWNEARQHPDADGPNGIKAWGQKVEAALWQLLDDETKAFAVQKEPTWQEEEQFAIDELVERLNGSFVGRTAIVRQALALASSPTSNGAPWGLCLVGDTGAGKSALFAHLVHELSRQKEVLLLVHAAGISPRAGQTEWMLRRWIGELGKSIGEFPEVPNDLKAEELEKLFAQLLHRVAAKHRVVVMVDALNQFVRTERARTVSWLPLVWPDNARFIATAIRGEETSHLVHHAGLSLVGVPPLDDFEVDAVAEKVYGRYHRQPNAAVLRELSALRLPDGTAAVGNPLWLTLALDLLNQLDADDFTEAESATGSSAEAQLRQVVLQRARTLPPDVEGLYGVLLRRVEKVAGKVETCAFAMLTALSRFGWREEDLEKLLPAVSAILSNQKSAIGNPQFKWNPLCFAVLRRCFRAHLVKRGALGQWDFAHATLRHAIQARVSKDEDLMSAIHRAIVHHLVNLPWTNTPGEDSDPLRESELMVHLIWAGDAEHAAQLLANIEGPYALRTATGYSAKSPSIQALADHITLGGNATPNSHLDWVANLLSHPGLSFEQVDCIAWRFNTDLDSALAATASLSNRRLLAEAVLQARQRLAGASQPDHESKLALSRSLNKVSQIALASGDLAASAHFAGESKRIGEQYATMERDAKDEKRTSLAGSVEPTQREYNQVTPRSRPGWDDWSEAPRIDWDDPDSLNSYKQKLEAMLAADLERQRELQEDLRELEADIHTDQLSDQDERCHALDTLGQVAQEQGDLTTAKQHFAESLAIREKIAASDRYYEQWLRCVADPQEPATIELEMPSRSGWQNNLAVSLNFLGNLALRQGDLDGSSRFYSRSHAIMRRLVEGDSSNIFKRKSIYQANLATISVQLGRIEQTRGDLDTALCRYTEAFNLMEQLVAYDPTNPEFQLGLAEVRMNIADISVAKYDFPSAQNYCDESVANIERIAASDLTNHNWQQRLCRAQERLANLAATRNDFSEAFRLRRLLHQSIKRMAELFPHSTAYQRALAMSHLKLAALADNIKDQTTLRHELQAGTLVLQGMKQRGIMLPSDVPLLEQLLQTRNASSSQITSRKEAAPSTSASPTQPARTVSAADSLPQTLRGDSFEEMREVANNSFQKGLWEVAAMYLEKLLLSGEPIEQVSPRLITCLLNAHETPLESDVKRIKTLLQQLEQTGYAHLAAPLRQQLQTILPRKTGWKFW